MLACSTDFEVFPPRALDDLSFLLKQHPLRQDEPIEQQSLHERDEPRAREQAREQVAGGEMIGFPTSFPFG